MDYDQVARRISGLSLEIAKLCPVQDDGTEAKVIDVYNLNVPFIGDPMNTKVHILQAAVEPLLLRNKVDLAVWGHVHNYEQTCAVFQGHCLQHPIKDLAGVNFFDTRIYSAPVHAVVGQKISFILVQFIASYDTLFLQLTFKDIHGSTPSFMPLHMFWRKQNEKEQELR
ncbi:hypothetical protein SELMODRAFT_432247, partial [Selaginella moellendorffii]